MCCLIVSLDVVFQAVLLEDHMRDLRRVIRPGAKRLNWNSLGINDFVAKCGAVSAPINRLAPGSFKS